MAGSIVFLEVGMGGMNGWHDGAVFRIRSIAPYFRMWYIKIQKTIQNNEKQTIFATSVKTQLFPSHHPYTSLI